MYGMGAAGAGQGGVADARRRARPPGPQFSQTMYSSISSGKSTFPQNRQLIVYYY